MASFTTQDRGVDAGGEVSFKRTATGANVRVRIPLLTNEDRLVDLTNAQITAALPGSVTIAQIRTFLLNLYNTAVTAAGGS